MNEEIIIEQLNWRGEYTGNNSDYARYDLIIYEEAFITPVRYRFFYRQTYDYVDLNKAWSFYDRFWQPFPTRLLPDFFDSLKRFDYEIQPCKNLERAIKLL